MNMETITQEALDAMKNVDIRTVDPDSLCDIQNVTINQELSKRERILDFINQIKNGLKIFISVSVTVVSIFFQKSFSVKNSHSNTSVNLSKPRTVPRF